MSADAPDATKAGDLRYRGGLQLTSPDRRFGGLSALSVSADGSRLVSLSDTGMRFSARLRYDARGWLKGIVGGDLIALRDTDGKTVTGTKKRADAEALSPAPSGGLIVGFERRHRLWRYRPGFSKAERIIGPKGLADLPANSGIEALALLPGRRLLAISEGARGARSAPAWVLERDKWSRLDFSLQDGFRITGAATVPAGGLLVLERRYRSWDGVAIRVRLLDPAEVSAGVRIAAPLIAELRPPLNVDNFEGIAARRDSSGRVLVYIVSDDNFNPLQRTLLMMFELLA